MATQPKQQKISKEVLERVMIGAIVTVGVLYGSWKLLLSPLREQRATVLKECEAVQATLSANQALVAQQSKAATVYEEAKNKLLGVMNESMPPPKNALAWAGDFFRKVSLNSTTGMRPQRILESGTMPIPVKEGQTPMFEEYTVRTDYQSDFHSFGHYLAALESANPLMRVDGFEVGSSLRLGDLKYEPGPLSMSLRTIFLRFTDDGFMSEERPDAETPRVVDRDAATRKGGRGGDKGGE